MEWLSVADASRVLQLSQPYVRRLASSGALPSHRFPGGWVLNAQAVRARRENAPAVGRPLSAAMSWLLLGALSADVRQAMGLDESAEPGVLSRVGDRKLRYRLRQLLAGAPPLERWPGWLRRRAEPRRVWVHPGVLGRMASDKRLHAGGAGAAASAGVGVAAPEQRRFYVREADGAAVLAEYRARADADGQVELLVVPSEVLDPLPDDASPVLIAAALLDMLESPDAREHHAAAQLLAASISRLAALG